MEICDRDAVNLEVRQSDGQVFLGHWHHAAPCTIYALHAYFHAPADVSYSQMLQKKQNATTKVQQRLTVLTVHHGDRSSPKPLPRHQPVRLGEDEHNVCEGDG